MQIPNSCHRTKESSKEMLKELIYLPDKMLVSAGIPISKGFYGFFAGEKKC